MFFQVTFANTPGAVCFNNNNAVVEEDAEGAGGGIF